MYSFKDQQNYKKGSQRLRLICIYVSVNGVVSSSGSMELNDRIITEQGVVRDIEGNDRSLTVNIIPALL
jgi:hypothetical protein